MRLHADIALAVGLAALPLAGRAEGARLVLDCVSEDGRATHFVVAPVSTDASGKGPIEVTRDGTTLPGLAASDHGPFQYGTESDHYALLFEGETADGRLAVQLHHATATRSTLTPYICEARP